MKQAYFFTLRCLFLLLLLLPAAGSTSVAQDTLRQEDGSFYTYPTSFAARLVFQERELPVILQPQQGVGKAVYEPNSNRTFGVGGRVFGISYTVSFPLPQALQRDPERFGQTTQRDLRISAFRNRFGLQLERQDYTGYYLNNIQELDADWKAGGEFPLRERLRVKRFGVGVSYLFQPDRFSFSAALNNGKRQRIGGGTFLVQLYAGRLWLGGDSLLLPRKYFTDAGRPGALEEVNVYHGSIMPGYAHTFVMGRFYLMTSLALGPEVQRRNLRDETKRGRELWAVEGRFQLQAAFGFDNDTYFWNLAYLSQRQQYEVEELGVTVNTNGFRLLVGRRFKDFRFIRKIKQSDFYQRIRGGE